ncbi:uncharacterized protein LOC116289553 [Actinia tenebrosa]|uniref:Uncharacterized protein LOC116289553 n=1 Tax=Actinia tenebrosa TaxID=6105 RepID=A0A6P8HIA6_ACTTE|nr:uncharacterized protein LOC116289553 [Actinia tenebrosa]
MSSLDHREQTMRHVPYFVACFLIFMTFVKAFPSQCKDDKFFDHVKQIYLPCSECENQQFECEICCSARKPELVDASISSSNAPRPSLKEKTDKAKYQILNLFLQSFIITMVICSLLVLFYVAYKVTQERQAAAECPQGNHFHNADAI